MTYFRTAREGRGSSRVASGEGDTLPDSQAGHLRSISSRSLAGSSDHQNDTRYQSQPTKDRRNGDMFLLFRRGVNRANIKNFCLVGIAETLISQSQAAKHDQ
jgi:hypothetical protein